MGTGGSVGADVRVGTSGYAYAHWKGLLYPPLLPPGRWLPLYAQLFRTLDQPAPTLQEGISP